MKFVYDQIHDKALIMKSQQRKVRFNLVAVKSDSLSSGEWRSHKPMWDLERPQLERNKDAILVELIKYDKVNAPNSMEKNAVCPKRPLHRYRRLLYPRDCILCFQ